MPPIEPNWLSVDDVIETNKQEVAETGEAFFIRNEGSLESACMRPYNLWAYHGEEDVMRLAAALVFGLAKNHPFEQGNKRTAFTAGLMFIEINGWTWTGEDDPEFWGKMVIELESGAVSEERFATALAFFAAPLVAASS